VKDQLQSGLLDGQAFIMLGAGGDGIGTATCKALRAAGASLLCVDKDAEQARSVAAAVNGIAHTADLTSRSEMQSVFEVAQRVFGSDLRGVVDVVGAAQPGSIQETDDEDIERQVSRNLRHAWLAIQIGGPVLAANGGGVMTFVGSLAGCSVMPRQAVYGMTKAALHHLVRYAALEFGGRGLRINAVAPGFVRTPRILASFPETFLNAVAKSIPLGRIAEPEDIAKVILFLSSNLADYVSGQVLMLDGGASTASQNWQ